MATYREGWADAARYCAAMVTLAGWNVETRERLYALARMLVDLAPEVPPPPDAEWRSKVPWGVETPPKEPPAP